MRTKFQALQIGSVFIIAYLALNTAPICLGLQNIRIQVNNENLQSPPYLLEALKQAASLDATATANATAPGAPVTEDSSTRASASNQAGGSRVRPASQNVDRREEAGAVAATSAALGLTNSNGPSFVKEETIEKLLDLQPESVLRLSPENLIQTVTSSQGSNSNNNNVASALVSEIDEHLSEGSEDEEAPAASAQVSVFSSEQQDTSPHQVSSSHDIRKPQSLPVTNSHLKRPVIKLDEPNLVSQTNQPQASIVMKSNSTNEQVNSGQGARSRVSPSVVADERPTVNLAKSNAPPPPDVWEPSQVMQGVTNASLVPATVRRQYGQQVRTRITLGGGYTRNKMPPMVNPSADEYVDDRPEKPVAPLERPDSAASFVSSAEQTDFEPIASGIVENSRLVEVPERIILPASVFKQQISPDNAQPSDSNHTPKRKQQVSAVASNATTIVQPAASRKRDPRCPAKGVKALGHPTACDMYYLCQDGQLTEHTCPNGLLFGLRDYVRDYCVHRWEADCGDKTIPNPISSPGCRWQNGIFNVQGSPKCTPDFYECKDGQFEVRKCSIGGQVYDDKTKSCKYAELVGCTQEALADFRCPPDDQTNTYWPFPRYFLNERALVHCVNDNPQIIRCRDHERVDPEHLFCVPINKSLPADEPQPTEPEITARQLNEMAHRKQAIVTKPAVTVPPTTSIVAEK